MGEIQDLEEDEENSKIYELELMKECLCKIENKNGKGVGFFCCIPYKKMNLFAMITNNHLVNDDILRNDKIIEIVLNNDEEEKKIVEINDNRKIYTSVQYDTTIIQINPKTDDIKQYLKIDENIFQQPYLVYENVYVLQYINNKNLIKKIKSKGVVNKIKNYNIKYTCNSSYSLSGCPLLNVKDLVIGIHEESLVNFNNNGILLKNPLNHYINDILNKNKKNEISLKIKIEKKDINKDIYIIYGANFSTILENGKYSSYSSRDFNKNDIVNNSNTELFINNKKYEFYNYFRASKEGIYDVQLKFLFTFKSCKEMFSNCKNIISIDLSFFDSSEITNTSHMFINCINLEKIDFSSFDTKNVTDMNNMFNNCHNLKNVNLSFFKTKNVENMSCMFINCYNLKDLYLSSFDTQNVTNISYLFSNCRSLLTLDLSSFDTLNVTNMSYLFSDCHSLLSLDLSSFDTQNVTNMNCMFYKCYSLHYVNLSSFKTYNMEKAYNLFDNCYNLVNVDLTNIKWEFRNKYFFNNCINLLI